MASPPPAPLRLPYHPALEGLLRTQLVEYFREDAFPLASDLMPGARITPACYEFWVGLVYPVQVAYGGLEGYFNAVNASYRICPLIGVQEERCGQCMIDSRISGQFLLRCPHEGTIPHPPIRAVYRPSAADFYHLRGLKHLCEALIQLFLTFFSCYQDVPPEKRLLIRRFAFNVASFVVVPPSRTYLYVVAMDLQYLVTSISRGPSIEVSRTYLVNLCSIYNLPAYLPFWRTVLQISNDMPVHDPNQQRPRSPSTPSTVSRTRSP